MRSVIDVDDGFPFANDPAPHHVDSFLAKSKSKQVFRKMFEKKNCILKRKVWMQTEEECYIEWLLLKSNITDYNFPIIFQNESAWNVFENEFELINIYALKMFDTDW